MRRLTSALGILAILFLLAVAGDRFAAGYAAAEVEQQLVAQGFRAPEVVIRGFPFVAQFIDVEYRNVEAKARSVEVAAGRAQDLTATLRGVRIDDLNRAREGQVRELAGRATVPYSEVEKAAQLPTLKISSAPGGEVRLTGEIKVLGEMFTVGARGRLDARGDHIRIVPTALEVEGLGELDDRLSSLLAERIAINYPIPSLPPGVSVVGIKPVKEGFRVDVSGRNARLRAP